MSEEIIEWWNERIKEQEYPSDYGGENFWEDDGWILSVSYNPTQGKTTEFAFNMLVADLEETDKDNVDVVRFGHWACGWVKQINVRPIVDGQLTQAGEMVYEYVDSNGYDYLERVFESDEYYEWEHQEYMEYIDYLLDSLVEVDADAFTDDDREAIRSYMYETGQCECTDEGVYQWFAKTDDDWYSVFNELFPNKTYMMEETID